MFEQCVLPVPEGAILKQRLMVEEGRTSGHIYSQPDLIIAATGAHHGLTGVIRDGSDFERARALLLNFRTLAAGQN